MVNKFNATLMFPVRYLYPVVLLNYWCFIFHCASSFCCFCCLCFTMDISLTPCFLVAAYGQLHPPPAIPRQIPRAVWWPQQRPSGSMCVATYVLHALVWPQPNTFYCVICGNGLLYKIEGFSHFDSPRLIAVSPAMAAQYHREYWLSPDQRTPLFTAVTWKWNYSDREPC
jgi:hypothetical protein